MENVSATSYFSELIKLGYSVEKNMRIHYLASAALTTIIIFVPMIGKTVNDAYVRTV
jgi:hypothetical protein